MHSYWSLSMESCCCTWRAVVARLKEVMPGSLRAEPGRQSRSACCPPLPSPLAAGGHMLQAIAAAEESCTTRPGHCRAQHLCNWLRGSVGVR